MRIRALAIGCCLLAVSLTFACQPAATPTPVATAVPTETPTPAPTSTLTPTPTSTVTNTPRPSPTPTIRPTAMPPRPTATAYPSSSRAGEYVNQDYGITLSYPKDWKVRPSEENTNIVYFSSPQDKVLVDLLSGTMQTAVSLDGMAKRLNDYLVGTLTDYKVLSSQQIQLKDGSLAWSTIATAATKSGTKTKHNISIAIRDSRYVALVTEARLEEYDAHTQEINSLVASLHLEEPKRYGMARKDVLVLAGSESTNPRTYDPATTGGGGDKLVFGGLVSLDPELKLLPDLAEAWQVTDGVTYTFALRRNARFHNGKPVKAQDFVYSWERAADPKTKSDSVLTYLGDIVGVKEMNQGKADHITGLQALDDYTLQVTVDQPKPYFLLKLSYPTAFVVDRDNVESGSEWYRTPNGTGPYRMIRWDRFSRIVYERNENYYLKLPEIRYVVVNLFRGVGMRLYEANDIDITSVGRYDVARVLDPRERLHAELQSGPNLCTSYVLFDVKQPPFDDLKVRQAFTLAFDRDKYIDVVLQRVGLPAKGLYPPGLAGYNSALKAQVFDPERARRLLAESKYGGPAGLPPILITSSGIGSVVGSSVAAQIEMWQNALGVSVNVENLDPNSWSEELNAGRHGQIVLTSWCADYPDPENFADVLFHSQAKFNWGHYHNPRVDALLEQARVEQDVSQRIRDYQQVEQMLLDDAAAVFVSHSISYVLVKPYVLGYKLTSISISLAPYLKLDPSKIK